MKGSGKPQRVRLYLQAECPGCKRVLFRREDFGLFCDAGAGCAFSAAGTVLDDRVNLEILSPVPPPKEEGQ